MDGLLPTAATLTFTRPAALWALAAVALPALLAWRARLRRKRIPLMSVAAQTLAIAVAALALANPLADIGQRAKLPHMLAIDASASVRDQPTGPQRLGLPAAVRVERLTFAHGLGRADRPAKASATRLAPVLRMIASRGPSGLAGAIIATDGNFTDHDWPAAARAVAQSGVDLLIVPMDAPPGDARVAAFTAVRRGGTSVEIVVTVSANAVMQRTLTVSRTGRDQPLLVRPLALLGRGPATVRVTDALATDAAAEYTAALSADDAFGENDSAAAIVGPLERTVAAVGAPSELRSRLTSAAKAVRFLAPAELPTDAAALAELSCLVIFDSTGSALTATQRGAVARYVRSGGGLVMVGAGPHAKPADDRDPLNRVLPLSANPFQRRPLHLFVLLDRSGSMARPAAGASAQQIKFDLASEATAALADHLTDQDVLTVITFAGAAAVAYDSAPGAADFAALRRKLAAIRPRGSTKVIPAIDRALAQPPAAGRTPMLLVLSDLRTEGFDPAPLAEKFRRAAAKLAVVAIREASDETPAGEPPLKRLAEELGAPYRERNQLVGLAEVFAELVRRGRGEAIRKQPTPIVVTAPVFKTGLAELGQLDAYILAALRDRSELLARTTDGDPLLAIRRSGLGRSVSLAAPLTDDLNAAWARTAPAGKLISAAIDWAARGANDPRLDVRLVRRADEIRIAATVRADDKPVTDMTLTAAVWAADEVRTAPLDQVAPGRYEADLPCPADASATVEIRDASALALWRGSSPVHYPPEFRRLGANVESLRRLAELTGGRIVSAGELAQHIRGRRRLTLSVLWPWLLAVALAIMLAEWSLTRITRE